MGEMCRVGPQGHVVDGQDPVDGQIPGTINDVEDAVEMGAIWDGNELVTYDMDGFMEQYAFYESNDYMIDND